MEVTALMYANRAGVRFVSFVAPTDTPVHASFDGPSYVPYVVEKCESVPVPQVLFDRYPYYSFVNAFECVVRPIFE